MLYKSQGRIMLAAKRALHFLLSASSSLNPAYENIFLCKLVQRNKRFVALRSGLNRGFKGASKYYVVYTVFNVLRI